MIRLALITAMLAAPVAAQQNCAPRERIVDHLATKYDEAQVGVGLDAAGNLIEVWAAASGSFTILVSSPNGLSCIATSGAGYIVGALGPAGEDM